MRSRLLRILPTPVAVGLRRFIYSNRFLRRILKPVNLAEMVHGHDLKSVILALEQDPRMQVEVTDGVARISEGPTAGSIAGSTLTLDRA